MFTLLRAGRVACRTGRSAKKPAYIKNDDAGAAICENEYVYFMSLLSWPVDESCVLDRLQYLV